MTLLHPPAWGTFRPGKTLLLAGVLASQPFTLATASDLDIELGLAAFYESALVVGEDASLAPMPYIELAYQGFSVNLSELAYSLPLSYARTLDLALGYRNSPFDPDDNTRLAQLDDRDTAIEFSLALSEVSPIGTLEGFVTIDASRVHQGWETGIEYSDKRPINGGSLKPVARLRYLSDNLVNYYFGITPQEAGEALPTYQAKGGLYLDLELTYICPFSPHWYSLSALEWTQLGAGQAESPISNTRHATRTYLALVYSF